jgi:MFS superfamily sulfate permease-like transporter
MADSSRRTSVFADLIGGISLTGLLVPEAVAYSSIAGLPIAFGITAAIAGPFAYALIGRSRLAVVSATSSAAALISAAIANSALPNIPRVDCAVALVLLVSLFFLIGAMLRVSALTSFVSRTVLHGFGFGLAITISVRQLPALLGMAPVQGNTFQVLSSVASNFMKVHSPSFLLGAAALIFLAFSRRFKFAPAGLVLIVATTAAMALGPRAHFGIAVVGAIAVQPSLPQIPLLQLTDWARLAQFAIPVAIVILAESWATIRSLAAASGDAILPQREIAALGLANLASGLLRGLPVGAGFSIGNANAQAGTSTRAGAIIAALSVALVVLTATRWIAFIPEPVLAAIVISALAHALSPRPFIVLFRLGRDQWVAIAAAAAVLLLGIINGLLVAVGLSVLGLLRRLAHPQLSELGRTGDHDFVDCSTHPEARPVSGMLVIRPNAPLFFGNADAVLGAVATRAGESQSKIVVLSLEETDDLDASSLEALTDFSQAMAAQKRKLLLARVHDRVRVMLDRGGLADLAATSTFSVDDAVKAASS